MQISLELNDLNEIVGWHDSIEADSIVYVTDTPQMVIGKIYNNGVLEDKPLTTEDRFKRLEQIFNDKTTGLKKIAVDKPWMTDYEAINNQYRVYEEMYKNALAGRYTPDVNTAIITANEGTKAALADLTLLLNNVRAVIENAIFIEADNVDFLLDEADAISLTKAELTPEAIAQIMTTFGLI